MGFVRVIFALVKQRIMFNLPCFGDFADFVAVPYDFENKNLD